jgi:predicted GIY-YIG superfamily endonuclease
MAPFDSLRSLMAGQRSEECCPDRAGIFHQKNSSESNALSKRSASKGFFMSASGPADSSVLRSPMGFLVYILRCADGSLYVGHTYNVHDRVNLHNEGWGALWTACRRPVTPVYQEPHTFEDNAIARERQIKRWTQAKKLALINGDRAKLKAVAKRRIR